VVQVVQVQRCRQRQGAGGAEVLKRCRESGAGGAGTEVQRCKDSVQRCIPEVQVQSCR